MVTTPDDPDFRLHLRNEVLRAGLGKVLSDLHAEPGGSLAVQVQVFEYHREEDLLELQSHFQDIRIEMDDPTELFNLLLAMNSNTKAAPFFLSILQHLMMIREEELPRTQYFRLIDECVSQIVLQHGGADPDFGLRHFQIDVEPLIDNMVDREMVDDALEEIENLKEQVRERTFRDAPMPIHSMHTHIVHF